MAPGLTLVVAAPQAFSLSPTTPGEYVNLLRVTLPGFGILLASALEDAQGSRVWVVGTEGAHLAPRALPGLRGGGCSGELGMCLIGIAFVLVELH